LTKRSSKYRTTLIALSLSCAIIPALAQSSTNWKTNNSEAISAMRSEKYEEAEKLFNTALGQCKLDSDKNIVKTNLALLLRKLGRESEAEKLMTHPHVSPFNSEQSATLNPNATPETKVETAKPVGRNQEKPIATVDANERIMQLDRAIKRADETAALETLQELFQKRADAVLFRDKAETLEYAYTLHHRALVHLHRDAEAKEIDTYAAKIRDRIRASIKKQAETKH